MTSDHQSWLKAKALYNLAHASAAFDADSPYWIVPTTIALALRLSIDDAEILRVIVP